MPKGPSPSSEPLRFATARAFESWLRKNHASSDGAWLLIAKAGAGQATVTYAQAVEIALCHGWIDGQKKGLDEQYWLQRFTPRRARSLWSKVNRAKAEALVASGRMQPSGRRRARSGSKPSWRCSREGRRSTSEARQCASCAAS
jgi:uncharacterized protein YdeI (YjbR/CyaY-like superfamily)